jgi:hypothetical protein
MQQNDMLLFIFLNTPCHYEAAQILSHGLPLALFQLSHPAADSVEHHRRL